MADRRKARAEFEKKQQEKEKLEHDKQRLHSYSCRLVGQFAFEARARQAGHKHFIGRTVAYYFEGFRPLVSPKGLADAGVGIGIGWCAGIP